MTAGLVAAMTLGADVQPSHAGSRQNEIKAAFVFNFARFTKWPPDRFEGPSDPIRVCAHEGHTLADALGTIDGKKVGARAIAVATYPAGGPLGTGCHIALLPLGPVSIPQRGMLTVGETPDFIERGGAVGLLQVGRQVRFQINQTSIREAELEMSSKLLRLATRVVK